MNWTAAQQAEMTKTEMETTARQAFDDIDRIRRALDDAAAAITRLLDGEKHTIPQAEWIVQDAARLSVTLATLHQRRASYGFALRVIDAEGGE